MGGQWPQVRLAQAGWSTDWSCQLCGAALGTLEHRRVCPAILPREGWPARQARDEAAWCKLTAVRQRLLQSRGLLAVKARVASRGIPASFAWHLDPTHTTYPPQEQIWLVDGSLVEGVGGLGRAGFAIVVIGADGNLIGCGSGRPPEWADNSASAEGWALY